MPFKSQAQRSYLFANHPAMAKRWAKETPKGKRLPKRKRRRLTGNAFCPTGSGGGVDPSCSPSGGGSGGQTSTPAFKAWFGKSKVVDESGKPLVVYHGTSGVFDTFDVSKGELGIHFGTKEIASGFGDRGAYAPQKSGMVVPAYLSIQNPLRMVDKGTWSELDVANALVEHGKMTPAERDKWNAGFEQRWKDHDWSKPYPRQQETQKLLEEHGHDGIVYVNRREGITLPQDLKDSSRKLNELSDAEFLKRVPSATTSYIAIRPHQIKSALGNRGTFDPKSSVITNARTINARRKNPLRADPSRTASIRRRFCTQVRKRFDLLSKVIRRLVVDEDGFGLKQVHNERFRFLTTAEQVDAFKRWLAQQMQYLILGMTQEQIFDAWWKQYAEEGYLLGAGRAFDETKMPALREAGLSEPLGDWYRGSKEDFLRSAFGHPVSTDRIKLLAGRTFNELEGVTDSMSQRMTRVLTDGLVQGKSPRDVAKDLDGEVGIGKNRALVIARTECLPASTLVDAAMVRAVFRRWYVGPMVEIETCSGRKFSATPNHPMLTTAGWVGAGSLKQGDDLIRHDWQQDSSSPGDEDIQRSPTTIGQIFDSLKTVGVVERIRTGKPDFHGDGMEGDVDVFCPDGELIVGRFSPLFKPTLDDVFTPTGLSGSRFCLVCRALLPVNQSVCFCGCSESDPGFHESSVDCPPVGIQIGSDGYGRLPGQVALGNVCGVKVGSKLVGDSSVFPSCGLRFGVGSDDSGISHNSSENLSAVSESCGKFADGAPVLVETDEVRFVRISEFSGHVFNLETPFGYFTIDGYYTGNTVRAHAQGALDSYKKLGVERLGVMVEWEVTEDDALCFECEALRGIVIKIDEAQGLIPRHPNCRCTFVPSNVGEDDEDQVRDADDIDDAIDASIEAEGGKGDLEDKRDRSTWQGADVDIDEKRPKSILENVFCPTGSGGGVDPSCSSGGSSVPREKSLSERSARAKAAYNPSTKEKQDAGERFEQRAAKTLGAKRSGDNQPMDLTINVKGKEVGLEVKTLNDAKAQRVNMRPDSRQRKEAWVKENKTTAWTLVSDNRNTYQDGKHAEKYSGHNLYIKQGVGAFSLQSMTKVGSLAEAKSIISGSRR